MGKYQRLSIIMVFVTFLGRFVKSHWPIIVIIIVAAVLRFWRLEALTTFGGDQGYDFVRVREILQGNFTLLGPKIGPYNTNSTFYLGPFYYYFLAPFLLISKLDPIGTSYAIILGRLTATFLIYLITKKLFQTKAAVFAAIISTISPYWVDRLGPPSNVYLILPTTALAILLIQHLGKKNKNFLIPLAVGILAGISLHFHYLGVVIFSSSLVYFLYNRPLFLLKNYLYLFLGFILSISPIILFELRNNFFLTNQFFKTLNFGLFNWGFANLISKFIDSINYFSEYIFGLKILGLVLTVPFVIIILDILRITPKLYRSSILFLITVTLLNLLTAILYFGPLQPHYLATAFVPLFIFTGAVIANTQKINNYLPVIIIIVISIFLFQKNNLMQDQGYTMPQDLTLGEIKKISNIIAGDVGGNSFNIASTLDGDSRAGPYRYLVKVYGKEPLGVEHYDNGDHLYVITRDPPSAVSKNPLFEISSFQPSNVSRVWEVKGNIRLVKLSKKEKILEVSGKIITVVNPVRARELWHDKSVKNLTDQLSIIKNNNLLATWLLQYDTLSDEELVKIFKAIASEQEIGAFLEVSEKWATDARVSYKVADGDYYRPDKVFLSGYSPRDRKKLITTLFKKFHEIYGRYPQSVGAWYIDAGSQKLLSKLGVKSALTVADQYDTDAASVWGKYFSMPYYPSKFNSLEPAKHQSEKIPIVNIQWAQRDPTLGYGKEIKHSRQSFQANDYISNGFDFSYFEKLLSTYLDNQNSEVMQVTIGLEIGQEAVRFNREFEKQINKVGDLQNSGRVEAIKMADFATWYQNKYPGISPTHFLFKNQSFWYMSPKFRVAIFKEGENYILKDLRYYTSHPFRDYLYADQEKYLERKIPALIDEVEYANQIILGPAQKLEVIENFDRLTLRLDNREVRITLKRVDIDGEEIIKVPENANKNYQRSLGFLSAYNWIKNPIISALSLVKYSKIDDKRVLGIALSDTKLIGLKGFSFGIFDFDFQSYSKFLSLSNLIERWQPWIR